MTKDARLAISKKVWQDPFYFIAFGFGLGNLPKAPGTWGSLLGIAFACVFDDYVWWQYALILSLFFAFGVWLCERVSNDVGVGDYPGIVWDEVVGMMLCLFAFKASILTFIFGFLLFRVFDIAKPGPISWVEKNVKGGLGIMLDDVLAGTIAWICLSILSLIGIVG